MRMVLQTRLELPKCGITQEQKYTFIRVVLELTARVRPEVRISTEGSHSAKGELVRLALKLYIP